MTTTAAKLAPAGADITRAQAEEIGAPSAASSLPVVAIASVAVHVMLALVLVSLPMPTGVAPMLEMTWIELDAPSPMPEVTPAAPEIVPPAPVAPPPEVVRHERPQPVAEVEPEIAPEPEVEAIAPPSIDEVFGEPPPPAAVLTGDGTSGAFAVNPGELGGMAGGTPGGHGTSLVSAVRPAPRDVGPSEADRRRARRGYVHAIEELVRGHVRYPRAAAREGLQGRVELGLRIGADGRVLAIRIATSSGSPILDDAAAAAAREIDHVPAPPTVAALTSSDEVRVGVVYMVR